MNCLAPVAQVRWDVGAEVGAIQRLTTDRPSGAAAPLPGPVGEVHAHLAIIPMLRLGVYLAQDFSPASGLPARQFTEAGARAKFSPPLFATPWHAWASLGAGYARTYEPSHGDVPGAGGGILDVLLGAALGYRLSVSWELFLELGGRVGVAFAGSMYDAAQCCAGGYVGRDSVALSLSLGLNLNR